MKKILTVLLAIVFVLALSACNNNGGRISGTNNKTPSAEQGGTANQSTTQNNGSTKENLISRERAIELALNHAGLQRSDIFDLETELDRERVGVFWEVDFEGGGFEYSYDVNAETEEVFKLEKERDR